MSTWAQISFRRQNLPLKLRGYSPAWCPRFECSWHNKSVLEPSWPCYSNRNLIIIVSSQKCIDELRQFHWHIGWLTELLHLKLVVLKHITLPSFVLLIVWSRVYILPVIIFQIVFFFPLKTLLVDHCFKKKSIWWRSLILLFSLVMLDIWNNYFFLHHTL